MRWFKRRETRADLRFRLVNAEAANKRLTEELALTKAEIVALRDTRRQLEGSLSSAREQLRQEQRERAREAQLVAPETLHAAMRRLEIPEQREESD